MFRFASCFRCGEGNECVVLCKEGRPLIVELPYVDQALSHGAEYYPVVCTSDSQCWIELTAEQLEVIEDELEWVYGW